MNNLNPVHVPDPQTKARSVSARRIKKAVVGLLVALVLAAMIGWLAFLGWGTVELFRVLASFIKNVWTMVV
jgi:uncharacterized membrane protein